MTLVETMSPTVTPSVDCVLNREWRIGTGPPGQSYAAFLRPDRGKSKTSIYRKGGEIRPSSAEFCVNIR